jgi:hypothetical protein
VGCAEVISLDEVRARTHWTTLRQRLHERFDRWLDQLEAALPEVAPTLGQVSETIWAIRQQLTGGVAETIVHHLGHTLTSLGGRVYLPLSPGSGTWWRGVSTRGAPRVSGSTGSQSAAMYHHC